MRARAGVGATAAVAAAAFLIPAGAGATTFKVTQTIDKAGACDERCALREAVLAANATPADDRIVLRAKRYELSLPVENGVSSCNQGGEYGDLDICGSGGSVKLIGKGPADTVIDANRIDRVLQIDGEASVPTAVVRLQGVALTGGEVSGSGDEGGGLAIDDGASARLIRSAVRGNRSVDDGGGIVVGSELVMMKSTVLGNRTTDGGDGGGIANSGSGVLTIRDSTVSGNIAKAASGNDGDGGGLNNRGTATIVNSTFSGNRAGVDTSSQGGAIYTDGDLILRNVTVAFNKAEDGGGVAAVDRVENLQTIENSVLADNTEFSGDNSNCGGFIALVSLGHNLEKGTTCEFAGPGDINGKPKLGALTKNGGPTKTHALGARSDAINRGKNATCPNRDQRGVKRPQGPRCDIGAFERKP